MEKDWTKAQKIAEKGIYIAALCLLLLGALLYVPAIVSASSQAGFGVIKEKELPIYCVDTPNKQVALSFDAAWGNEQTRTLLDILKKHNVKATFFMTGEWVEKYPEDVKMIVEEGHDIGNHSENHLNMSQLTKEEMEAEIMTVHNRVKELTGVEMTLFRPPYGDYNDDVVKTANKCGYYCIQWSVDSLDWKDYGTEDMIKRVCNHKNMANGAIVLMHNGGKYTPEALESIITGLETQGYELVPISQLIIKENYHMDYTGKQIAD